MFKRNEVILNERNYVEKIIESGDLGKKPGKSLLLAAKLYREKHLSDDEIRDLLGELITRHDPSASIVKWEDQIKRAVRNSEKAGLVEIDSIPVTKLEMDICKSIKSVQKQRVMFTLFCLAKFEHLVNDKNYGWVNTEVRTIFTLSNVAVTSRKQSLMISDLVDDGYVQLSKTVDSTNLRVVFMDLDSPPSMEIRNFKNLGNQYTSYISGSSLSCKCCGEITKRTASHQLYCKECAKKVMAANKHKYYKNGTQCKILPVQ